MSVSDLGIKLTESKPSKLPFIKLRITGRRTIGPCTAAAAKVNARLQASGHMLLGLEVPRCEANGDYKGMQFAGSQ